MALGGETEVAEPIGTAGPLTQDGMVVTSLCAEGAGWSPAGVGAIAWEEGGFTVSLEGPGVPEQAYRAGPDADRRGAMFATFLSALESGRCVCVTTAESSDGGLRQVLKVVLPVQ